jgi:hypothetical protein
MFTFFWSYKYLTVYLGMEAVNCLKRHYRITNQHSSTFQETVILKKKLITETNKIWCDFDRASSLICGNKMPVGCNKWFLLRILLLAQHVLGTIMPIIRSSRVLYRWLLPVVFGALVSFLWKSCAPLTVTEEP